ncbi:MAG: sugar phosphate isomerase/epimerase [Clostridia bacterium]|nr:sugar phosphate isomerase/epimerase [Clostridia bacterium]
MKIAVFYENIAAGARAEGRPMEDTLARLKDAGMDLIYLSTDSWEQDRRELRGILNRLNLGIEGMHTRIDFPQDPDTALYRGRIDMAADSGAGNLLIVPGMLSTGHTVRDLNAIVQGMRRAVAYGQKKGLPILMEDYDGLLAPYNCMAGLQYFLNAVPGLGCAFDTGNFVMFHEDELAAFDLFAPLIQTLHLKDRTAQPRHPGDDALTCADGQRVYCCAVGSGSIRMAEILRRLKARQYQGNVIVELYCCDPAFVLKDICSSIAWLRAFR